MKCQEQPGGSWKIFVVYAIYNHKIGSSLYGHPLAGRLTPEKKNLVKRMTRSNYTATQVACTLNEFPLNYTRKRQVYSARYRLRREDMEGRTVVQEFFHKAREYKYYVAHVEDPQANKVTDVFFASPDSISLLKEFPYVLLLDSTYNTNK